jgi:hypothetical protein
LYGRRYGRCTGADTECEICVGAYFPGHKVASGRHGVDSTLPHVTGTIQPMVGDGRTVGGGFNEQCSEPAVCT